MKRLRLFLVLSLLVFLLFGCGSMWRITKDVVWPDFTVIPSPRPGLVLPINSSPGVWAESWLFEGSFIEEGLIVPNPAKGGLEFAKSPLKHFVINPPISQPYKRNVISTAITVPLLLPAYPANYTLLIFHQNFLGTVVRIEVKRFSTTGYAFNSYYMSGGRKIYADKVIRLARVRPYERRQFRFHRTFYPGHFVKEALGLP